ncbi:MAG: hypothetical protein Q8O53_02875 [Candidatus Moranbacteria bacterium]|nr:hypothetical protein [Candidatus Moranbacteria bacterium]
MRNTRAVRPVWLRTLLKIHALAFTIVLGVYFVLAFFDPGLLSYDLRQKFHALADETITITATVLGPPVKPVVSATADCDEGTGTLSVALDWATDPNSYTYDVERDNTPLVAGLTNSAYSDTNVVIATTYQYVVTANGPMGPGVAVSDPVSVTTPSVCDVTLAAPAVTIVSFNGRGIDGYDGTPRVKNRRPVFSGTTSMANATLLVVIGGVYFSQFSANANGYWEWKPPSDLPTARNTFSVTATDLSDGTRQATATLRFDILQRDEGASATGLVRGGGGNGTTVTPDAAPPLKTSAPLDFSLIVQDKEAAVLQGEFLHTVVTIETLEKKYSHITVPIRYTITDENQGNIFSETRQSYITEGAVIETSLVMPLYMNPGKYIVRAEILLDSINVSRMVPFSLRELPLMRLSSGAVFSYADLIRHLGWIVFSTLLFLFLWLSLFIREYILYLQRDGEVTEYDLVKAGFIRR